MISKETLREGDSVSVQVLIFILLFVVVFDSMIVDFLLLEV